jgi:hypothetical protein
MAVPTLTEQLDNYYTTTWQNMKSQVADNIFDATPFWFWLKAHDGLESVAGGRFLTEPLRYAKSDNVAWVTRGSTVTMDDKQFLTIAQDNWRYLADSIVRYGVDDQQNRGKNQIINLATAKLNNSQDSLIDTLETALAGTQSGSTINGLQNLVADNPATGTLQGIDRAAQTWFRNQKIDMTGESFATYGIARMRTMYNNCMNNLKMDRPNIVVSGQTPYERYEDEVDEQKRIVNKTMGDAGFENIQYKGVPMVWSPAIAATRMYFLNTRFLKFKYDPALFFDMTEWKAIPNQINDRAAQVVLAGNLMTSRPRCQGVIFGMNTD